MQKAQGLKPKMYQERQPGDPGIDAALKLPEGVTRTGLLARLLPAAAGELRDPAPARRKGRWDPQAKDFRTYGGEGLEGRGAGGRTCIAGPTPGSQSAWDGQIGKVLSGNPPSRGLEDHTVVVFTSDHGDMDSSHRLEHKSMPYDEASRVPLIVSLKGVTRPGLVDREHLASTTLDLIPTLCDFAGIEIP